MSEIRYVQLVLRVFPALQIKCRSIAQFSERLNANSKLIPRGRPKFDIRLSTFLTRTLVGSNTRARFRCPSVVFIYHSIISRRRLLVDVSKFELILRRRFFNIYDRNKYDGYEPFVAKARPIVLIVPNVRTISDALAPYKQRTGKLRANSALERSRAGEQTARQMSGGNSDGSPARSATSSGVGERWKCESPVLTGTVTRRDSPMIPWKKFRPV